MTLTAAWPALLYDTPLPARLEYERAVWGKVHAAPTDFRWIARSFGFDNDGTDLKTHLGLGGEDAPARFTAWRNLGDRCYAVAAYPSRSTDAAGRRGFLEKQMLAWRRPPQLPAAVGALLLLSRASTLTDEIWWNQNGELSTAPDHYLSIAAANHEPIAVNEDELGMLIERGRQQLRELVPLQALEQLYEQLLSQRQPALLPRLPQPLPAEAIAVLLLPLPRSVADRISIAGWIPSHRPVLDDLGSRWNVLVTGPDQAAPLWPASPNLQAGRMAEALLSTSALLPPPVEPQRSPVPRVERHERAPQKSEELLRPGLKLDLTRPAPGAAPVLEELYAFAADANRRWLQPQTLRRVARSARLGADAVRLLSSWIRELGNQRPSYADERQWRTKIDLLRSAAIVLVPEPATVHAVQLPAANSHVPALLFALLFENLGQRNTLAGLGEKTLREVLGQSVQCETSHVLRRALLGWLRHWQTDARRADVNVPSLIAAALASQPR